MRAMHFLRATTVLALLVLSQSLSQADPVVATHPRILLTPAVKAQLLARKNASDPRWLRLKARADELVTFSFFPYKWATRTTEPPNTIFYDYQGEGWSSAAMPLGLAYQMTGDTAYSNKLFGLVDEMLRAQTDPDNMPPLGLGPLVPDNYYSTRNLCPVLAIVFDWCNDQLTPARRTSIVSLMNLYYNELRDSAYQRNDHADGNYYVGHMFGTALMGYASFGDNPKAQEMIDWARIRFDGTTSALIDAEHTPEDFFAQLFEGGTRPQPAREYNGPYITAAPHKGGIHLQGWAYGTATYNWIIDYMLTVRSATGEDLIARHGSWMSQMLRALKSGLLPNRFEMDPTGDYGGNYGAVMFRSLPVRLAHVLAGTADGPGAQNFAYNEIAKTSPFTDFPEYIYQAVYQPTEWEDFYFSDATRPAQELTLPPFYSGFAPVYPQGGATNGAMPFFYMRTNWDTTATWASVHQGAAWYDDHQHADAGTFQIKRANDYLLVDAANWKGAQGSIGIVGSSQNAQYNAGAAANTLFFDDFGDYQLDQRLDSRFCGGQGLYGRDIVTAAEQTSRYSYIRSDLSSAYIGSADTTDTAPPALEYFNRALVFLRDPNLFVVYDQTKARASNNPRGAYRKHMRWHFPNRPTVNGSTLSMLQGESQLNMLFVLPEQAVITTVDETNNPDPCASGQPDCEPYGFNSGTWRAEVSDGSGSLTTPFLTVLQPLAQQQAVVTATRIATADGKMTGAVIGDNGGYVVMFNNGVGPNPAPVEMTAYVIADATMKRHVLVGMRPGGKYAVTFDGVVAVVENVAGAYTASEAGVLDFGTSISGIDATSDRNASVILDANYPNPFSLATSINFVIAKSQRVTLKLFDALGREIMTILDADLTAGRHSAQLSADELPNGIYTIILRGESVQTRQCVVLK